MVAQVRIAKSIRKRPKPLWEWEFDLIWPEYPRKLNRKLALAAYVALRRKKVPFGELRDAVRLYARQRANEDPKFTLRAETFFGPNERWKEPFEEEKQGNGKSGGKYRPPVTDLGALDD